MSANYPVPQLSSAAPARKAAPSLARSSKSQQSANGSRKRAASAHSFPQPSTDPEVSSAIARDRRRIAVHSFPASLSRMQPSVTPLVLPISSPTPALHTSTNGRKKSRFLLATLPLHGSSSARPSRINARRVTSTRRSTASTESDRVSASSGGAPDLPQLRRRPNCGELR